MLGPLGTPASSTTKTGRHDITERDMFTLLSAIAFYIVAECFMLFYLVCICPISRAGSINSYKAITNTA